jgi:hypothetical protein
MMAAAPDALPKSVLEWLTSPTKAQAYCCLVVTAKLAADRHGYLIAYAPHPPSGGERRLPKPSVGMLPSIPATASDRSFGKIHLRGE